MVDIFDIGQHLKILYIEKWPYLGPLEGTIVFDSG
jgi:hypothetical protein